MDARAIVALLAIATLSPQQTEAQSDEAYRLRGLDSLGVVIEVLNDAAERAGLTENRLRTVVELEMRRSGIRVTGVGSAQYVYVQVSVIPAQDGYMFSVLVAVSVSTVAWSDVHSLITDALVPGDTTVTIPISEVFRLLATGGQSRIWEVSRIGTTGPSGASEYMIDAVEHSLQQFLNDYLAANPRQ